MIKELKIPSVQHFHMPGTPAAVLDIVTSTHYYRTSLLTEVRLITVISENETPKETVWTLEKESDDFDILMELAEALKNIKVIITFNGTSFDIPHLTKKYGAYRLPDPFEGKHFLDLLLKFKKFDPVLNLPSHKLESFMTLFPENEVQKASSDAEKELLLTSLLPFEGFLAGNFQVTSVHEEGGRVLFSLAPTADLPVKLHVSDSPFELTLNGNRTLLSAELFDGRLRRYYPNFGDYEFLTKEGYAVHKSVSAGVGKDRKEKAVRENCFSFVKCTDKFLQNNDSSKKYVISALSYMLSR